MSQAIAQKGNRFVRDRRGNIAMLFGLFGTISFVTVGGALDYGRWMHARYHTGRALDAAVLAGGRALQVDNANPAAALILAKKIYDSNISARLALKADTVQFITADNNMAVTATGQASMKTILLGIIGIHELPVAGTAGSKFPKAKLVSGGGGSSNMEVALMLDVTGSMCDNGMGPCDDSIKLDGMKEAAKELVEIVVQGNQVEYTSRVAIIPFSSHVRVAPNGGGAAVMASMTNLPATWSGYTSSCTNWTGSDEVYNSETGQLISGGWTCTNWQVTLQSNWKIIPCITDRMYNSGAPYNYTDVAPSAGNWMNANDGSRWMLADDSGNTPISGPTGASAAEPSWQWNYNSDGSCWESPEGNQVMGLSSNKSDLNNKIDNLQAVGSTAGALGTAATWYMLSPNWNAAWADGAGAGPYSDLTVIQPNGKPKLRKVAVLMSDGVFNTFRSWKGQDQQTVSNHAKQLCTNMKAAGIEIYAVAFDLDSLPAAERLIAEDTLKSCGTDLAHFYSTLTVAELKEAFKEIAMSLTTVYLTE